MAYVQGVIKNTYALLYSIPPSTYLPRMMFSASYELPYARFYVAIIFQVRPAARSFQRSSRVARSRAFVNECTGHKFRMIFKRFNVCIR